MGDVKLEAGAVLDLLSGDEYEKGTSTLTGKLDKISDQLGAIDSPPMLVRVPNEVTTDASGNIGGGSLISPSLNPPPILYRAPVGQTARIVRMSLADGTHTPIAPLAAGWLMFYVDQPSPGNLVTFAPQLGSTNVLPNVYTDGTHSATMLRDGQALIVVGGGLPANTNIGVGLQVWLYPTSGRPE